MRRLKNGGISAFSDIVVVPLTELVASLKEIGMFLVPVGELEGWLSSCSVPESKANKAARANAAALLVQSLGCQKGISGIFCVRLAIIFVKRGVCKRRPWANVR